MISPSLDACAGYIKAIAIFALNGDDVQLMELVGEGPSGQVTPTVDDANPHKDIPATIRGGIAGSKGIGRRLLLSAIRNSGSKAPENVIEEAAITLKASGEHDRIIAAVAAEVQERQEAARIEAEERAEAAREEAERKEAARAAAEEERTRRAAEAALRKRIPSELWTVFANDQAAPDQRLS